MYNVKIAYMMQVHKNSDQINNLIKQLDDGNSDFYIHIDKKSNIKNSIMIKENVFLISDCIDVKWGQISQVKATLLLMKEVKNSGMKYDYVWLISGQDFPIKSNKHIQDFLIQNKGYNFINLLSEKEYEYNRYLKRNETWYPTWGASPKFIMRVIRKLYNYITGGPRRSLIKRQNYLNVDFQFGSSWFTITYDTMLYILEEINKNEYMKYFKNCICPDESVFQTIIYNSRYKDTIRDYLTYVDWSEGKKNPKILNSDDLDKLTNSNKLMARKFEYPIDDKILKLSK